MNIKMVPIVLTPFLEVPAIENFYGVPSLLSTKSTTV